MSGSSRLVFIFIVNLIGELYKCRNDKDGGDYKRGSLWDSKATLVDHR